MLHPPDPTPDRRDRPGRPRAIARIATTRLRLRPLGPEDAPRLGELFARNRGPLERWTGLVPEDADEVLEYLELERAEAEAGLVLAHGVFARGALIGAVQVILDRSGAGRLGYWIDVEHGGRGFAFEAAAALARVALALGFANRLELRCRSDNHASLRVARRLGFRLAPAGDHLVGDVDAAAIADGLAGALTVEAFDGEGRALLGADADPGATWDALRSALEQRFAGRVPLLVRVVQAAGEPAALFSACIASEHAVAPQELLEHNASLAVGALCLSDGQVVLRHIAPLAGMNVRGAVRAVELIVDEARRLARRYASRSGHVFSTFED